MIGGIKFFIKSKMKNKFIKIDLYHQRIYLTDESDAQKYCENLDLSLYDAVTYTGYRERICFYTKTNKDDIIVHECVHLANFIIDRCGVYYTPRYDEALAYLVQEIYKKIKQILNVKEANMACRGKKRK